eukprot:CAMPEP_0117070892 /NCGR_PEP_ID=MMETSP0472-20121206/49813_1 /TAXON_ID=693140 ORGANISM="Tiarina fusus, Strain LIS" /NCGR_SAMPLE_ID=MMETSP0472 /ASSEMBLY_ACC=CAM_ASM_000603 /LENGTH=73 /DNA_ID=CAMNT_0004794197 /DNA_START=57 /DNA_END=275 /DNA_ORIENTATION=-
MENSSCITRQIMLLEPKCYPLPETAKYDWLLPGEDYELEITDVIYVKYGIGVAHGTLTCTNYQIRFDAYDTEI